MEDNRFDKAMSHLESILRYIAPGFVALLLVLVVFPNHNPFGSELDEEYVAWAAVIAAALGGMLIYSVHSMIIDRILCCIMGLGGVVLVFALISDYWHMVRELWACGTYYQKPNT